MSHRTISFSRRHFLKASACFAIAGASMWVMPVHAAKMNVLDGVAIQGYDPVANATQSAAVAGDAGITADYDGATYQFASAANRDAFVANPVKYAPQYGGFCAYAVSKGYTAPIDPQAFTVVDDKLYLNFSPSVKRIWSKDISGNIVKGDSNWPELSAN